MIRYLGTFILGAALLAPASLSAEDHHKSKRYYDRDGRDYHEWNQHENEAYRRYLAEQHRQYREFTRTNRREQQEYWRWRHNHGDDDRR